MPEKVHVFWDNSNIFIAAKYVAEKRDGILAWHAGRIHFDNLFNLARGGRTVQKAICVGSIPPELEGVWARLRNTGVTVELFERGKGTGTEQGVDQCLQVHMLRTLADEVEPGVAVLLTGDGAGYDTGAGFHADLERLHKCGWGIEVISWEAACKRALREWATDVGTFIRLDDYYESVTFVAGGRPVRPLSLMHRPHSKPHDPSKVKAATAKKS